MAVCAGVPRRVAVMAAAAVCTAVPALAQERTDTTGVHVIRPGDTLWDLAEQYLADPFEWPRIYRLNDDRVADPDLIFPLGRLRIPGAGDPLEAGGAPAGEARDVLQAPAQQPPPRTVFFPSVRSEGRLVVGADEATAAVVARGEYLSAPQLVPAAAIAPLGSLAEVVSPTVVPVEFTDRGNIGDRAYLRLSVADAVRPGQELQLLRPEREVEPFGRVFRPTGIVTVEEVQGTTATVRIGEVYDAVDAGDLAVPLPVYEVPSGVVPRESAGVEGTIVAFDVAQPVPGVRDLAFVDVGSSAGLAPGDEFEAILPATREDWGLRPEIRIARLRVIRAAERTSVVRVLTMEQPALEAGLLVRLVGKMPSS